MKKSTILNIFRILFTLLWRLALSVAVVAALCILGCAMVLNMVFNGPSVTARDQLTMTLLESEVTGSIPGYFLSEETIAQIRGEVVVPSGCNDPKLVNPSAEGGILADTFTSTTYAAQVVVIPDCSTVRFATSIDQVENAVSGDHIILASNVADGQILAGITESGILLFSDDSSDLLCIEPSARLRCGPVLIRNGQVNAQLFGGSSGYAPRAAIGQRANGTLIFVTTDGWTQEHAGATYQDMINILVHYGAVNACMLSSDAHREAWLSTTTAESEG